MRVSKSRFSISESDNHVSVAHFNRAHTGNTNYGADCIGRKRNDTLSETKFLNDRNTQKISTRKTNNGESVVIISNLDSDHDITSVVNQLLSKNKFSDASSIFVVVPTSDENDSDLSSDCSTICIELSKDYPNWNQKQCNIEASGLNCDGYHWFPEMNVTQQASFVSINKALMSVSQFAIPPCVGHPGCHRPSNILQIPYGTPMPPPVAETTYPVCGPTQSQITELVTNPKPILEQKQSKSCQCSPDKLKEIFEKVLKGIIAPNFKSVGCSAAADNPPTKQATISKKPLELVSSDSDDDEYCGNCAHHKYIKENKMKCAFSGKTRTIKIRPLCPCEQHQPPVSKTIAGPKVGTRSRGSPCCCSNDSTIKGGPELEVLVPARRVCQIEPGRTNCKASRFSAATSTDPKKPCKDCTCVRGTPSKKNIRI